MDAYFFNISDNNSDFKGSMYETLSKSMYHGLSNMITQIFDMVMYFHNFAIGEFVFANNEIIVSQIPTNFILIILILIYRY
jgi:hypothetical protein